MAENGNGNGNGGLNRVGMWASVALTGFAVLAAMFNLYATANTALAATNEMQHRVASLEATTTDDRLQISSICAHLVEVETQFRAADQIRNQMHLHDLRTIAILWQKDFRTDYPAIGLDLPTISQEQPVICR